MEDHILDEINHLTEQIDKSDGNEFDVRKYFSQSVSNNINSLIIGHRMEYSDQDRKMIDELLEPDPTFSLVGILAFFPALTRFVFGYLHFLLPPGFKKSRMLTLKFMTFVRYTNILMFYS